MPSDMGVFTFGSVVLVPFPFTDQSTTKRRPAVVISAEDYHDRRPDIILMPITSQLRGDTRYGDVTLNGWEPAGLLKPSAIKPLIATLEQALIIRRLGALQQEDSAALRAMLAKIIG